MGAAAAQWCAFHSACGSLAGGGELRGGGVKPRRLCEVSSRAVATGGYSARRAAHVQMRRDAAASERGAVTGADAKMQRDVRDDIEPVTPIALSKTGTPETLREIRDVINTVEFPKPLNALQRALRAASFWTRVLPILLRYQKLNKKLSGRKGQDLSSSERSALWDKLHEWGSTELAKTITDLKGFYVKSGQVISSRVDLFPEQYILKLATLQDSMPPIDSALVRAVVSRELLEGEPLDTLFASFDDKPLGSASIAQVHAATLVDGRRVAIKVQRPAEEPKLRADVANLKLFAKRIRGLLPVDYYLVFSELERALEDELDFRAEAQAMEKIHATIAHRPNGEVSAPPLLVPRPIPGLVSRRVLVMEFVEGIPLSRLAERMQDRGVSSDSPEARLVGSKLLAALTESYARMIFGNGFFQGDAHPGNIFVLPDATGFALIDCGQVKQLASSKRLLLAELMLTIRSLGNLLQAEASMPVGVNYSAAADSEIGRQIRATAALVRQFGVETSSSDRIEADNALAAIALLLFGPTTLKALPGGYSTQELSKTSPLREVASFPQDLVMLGRATILIKGLAARLRVSWNLSEQWAESCEQALVCGVDGCYRVPVYAAKPAAVGPEMRAQRPKFREVLRMLRAWAKGKAVEVTPGPVRRAFARRALKSLELKEDENPTAPTKTDV